MAFKHGRSVTFTQKRRVRVTSYPYDHQCSSEEMLAVHPILPSVAMTDLQNPITTRSFTTRKPFCTSWQTTFLHGGVFESNGAAIITEVAPVAAAANPVPLPGARDCGRQPALRQNSRTKRWCPVTPTVSIPQPSTTNSHMLQSNQPLKESLSHQGFYSGSSQTHWGAPLMLMRHGFARGWMGFFCVHDNLSHTDAQKH